ncbi:MAG: HEAT repeat domain-containing protein [Spirochaetota bacterium]
MSAVKMLVFAAAFLAAAGSVVLAQQEVGENAAVVTSTSLQNAFRLISVGDRQDMLVAIGVMEASGSTDPRVIQALSSCLDVGITFKRRAAARTINDFWDVRMRAAQVLGNIGDPSGLPALHEALRHEPDPVVKSAIIDAVGRIGRAESIPHLHRVAHTSLNNSYQSIVLLSTIEAVAHIGHPDGYWILYDIIKESCDHRVRTAAEKALEKLL